MAQVFKKIIVRHLDTEGRQVPKGTPDARRVKEKSAKWYGRIPGSEKPVPLSPNKVVAQQMLAALINKSSLEKVHGPDPFGPHRERPLSEHLGDFLGELQARGDEHRHVSIVGSRLRALLGDCGFVFLSDVSASRVMDHLAQMRRDRTPASLPDSKEWFTPRNGWTTRYQGRVRGNRRAASPPRRHRQR